MADHVGSPLTEGDELKFGASTRTYKISVDYTMFKRSLEEKRKAL